MNILKSLTFLLLTASSLLAQHFDQVIIFGDSLSDTGHHYRATEGKDPHPKHYHEGRFSNGPLWHEYLVKTFRTKPQVLNFAFAGARTGFGYKKNYIPNVGEQINDLLSSGHQIHHNALICLWAGGNDFLAGNPKDNVSNLIDHIRTLAKNGATHFLVPNIPPLSNLPALEHEAPQRMEKAVENYLADSVHPQIHNAMDYLFGHKNAQHLKSFIEDKSHISSILQSAKETFSKYLDVDAIKSTFTGSLDFYIMAHNNFLRLELENLERELGINIYHLDVHSTFKEVLKDPYAFGIYYTHDRALHPHTKEIHHQQFKFLFYDAIHPTTTIHAHIGYHAAQLINPT